MIPADQPTCFDNSVIAAVSSRSDGQQQHGWAEGKEEVNQNRQAFLSQVGIELSQVALVRVNYNDQATYDKILVADKSFRGVGAYQKTGEIADCLVTSEKDVALYVPVADCIATVVYDPLNPVVALAHLGRHSTVAKLANKLVTFLQENYNSQPEKLIVWMSPSIQAPNYILQYAEFAKDDPDWDGYCLPVDGGFSLDMQGFNQSLFVKAGVLEGNIYISPIDTASSSNYWSHYTETTVKKSDVPPRFAVTAMLK